MVESKQVGRAMSHATCRGPNQFVAPPRNPSALSAATNQGQTVSTQSSNPTNTLTQAGRYLIVISAFLGWFFAGWHLGINSLAMGSAAKDLLRDTGQYEVMAVDRESAKAQIEKDGGGHRRRWPRPPPINGLKPTAAPGLATTSARCCSAELREGWCLEESEIDLVASKG